MPVIDIHDGQSINIGNAGGPRLTFELDRQPERAPTIGNGATQNAQSSTISWETLQGPAQSRSRPAQQIAGLSLNAPSPASPPAMHRRPSHPASLRPQQTGVAPPPPQPTPPSPTGLQRSASPGELAPADLPPDKITVVDAGSAPPAGQTSPAETTVVNAESADVSNLATRFVKFLSQRPASSLKPLPY